MKQLRTLKKWVSDYEIIKQGIDDLEVLMEFEKSGDAEAVFDGIRDRHRADEVFTAGNGICAITIRDKRAVTAFIRHVGNR